MEPPVSPRLDLTQQIAEIVLIDAEVDYPPVRANEILNRYSKVIIFDAKKLQGFCWLTKEGYLVGFNKRYSYYRHQWTYAHELGHIQMGHLWYDRKSLSVNSVNAFRREAEWFAANLLMPEKWMRQLYDDYGLSSFSDLRRYVQLFDVSWKAMQIRLTELNLCDEEYLQYLTLKSG